MSNLITRFKDADFMSKPQDILLVGLGGIGRGTASELINVGHSLTIYETDLVEEHNCIPQGYWVDQIGCTKYQAWGTQVSKFLGKNQVLEAEHINEMYNKNSYAAPIMISCVDNMQARKDMFENWKKQEDRLLFVDGRMLAEYFEVFCVTPETEEQYLEYLFDDSEVLPQPCTYQQTSFVAKIIHGTICQSVCNFLTQKPIHFKIVYNGSIQYWSN
jgi:hypothetical protein